MVQYFLFCILWSQPNVKLVEAPVSEYAMANINENFGGFNFSADVIEEKLNSVQITQIETQYSTLVTAPHDYQQRSLYAKLTAHKAEASIDCEVRNRKSLENSK